MRPSVIRRLPFLRGRSADRKLQKGQGKRKRWPWVVGISLSLIVALLLAAGAGAVYAVRQYNTLVAIGNNFCTDFQTHNYAAAYTHFASNVTSRYSSLRFTQLASELDQIEGPIAGCQQNANGSYSVNVGQRSVTVAVMLTRHTTNGNQPYPGNVTFTQADGTWKVSRFDSSLLGLSLDALQAADAYCADVMAENYAAAYALLGHEITSVTSQADYVKLQQLHDQADGAMLSCAVTGLNSGTTGSHLTLTLNDWRFAIQPAQGEMQLTQEGGAWKVTALASALQGNDLTPILQAQRWCSDIAAGNYGDAYAISGALVKSGLSESAFTAVYSGKRGGTKWTGCTPVAASFQDSPTAPYMYSWFTTMAIATGQKSSTCRQFIMTKHAGAWTMYFITPPSPTYMCTYG